MEQIKAYKCDYCGKVVQTKSYMKKHESICFWNIVTNSCITCANLEQVEYANFCKKKNIKFSLKTNCPVWQQ